jgi:hypothetical protein
MATLIGTDAVAVGGGMVAVKPWANNSKAMLLVGSADPDPTDVTFVDLTRENARELASRLLEWADTDD